MNLQILIIPKMYTQQHDYCTYSNKINTFTNHKI